MTTTATVSDNTLSLADVDRIADDYERDGVVRVNGVLSADDLKTARSELARIFAMLTPAHGKAKVTYEPDGKTIRNTWHLERDSKFFDDLWQRPDIQRLMSKLLHGEPELSAVETFNKPARVGTAVPPHQDNAYFCQNPPDMLTVWIAIDPATLENGPIYYVPGSHRELRPHKPSGVTGNSMGLAEPVECSEPFVGTLEPGDALIHHCQTIHYSAPNTTDESRCALLIVYRGKHTKIMPQWAAKYALGKQLSNS